MTAYPRGHRLRRLAPRNSRDDLNEALQGYKAINYQRDSINAFRKGSTCLSPGLGGASIRELSPDFI